MGRPGRQIRKNSHKRRQEKSSLKLRGRLCGVLVIPQSGRLRQEDGKLETDQHGLYNETLSQNNKAENHKGWVRARQDLSRPVCWERRGSLQQILHSGVALMSPDPFHMGGTSQNTKQNVFSNGRRVML